jgi:3-hydroxyisobutyrate dehydrogenase
MVRRLVEAGHDVRALGRTPQKRAAVRELGAEAVSNLADVARNADVVIVCVFTDEQARQVCLDGDLVSALARGAVLVIHTTGSPRTAEAIAERGIQVVGDAVRRRRRPRGGAREAGT